MKTLTKSICFALAMTTAGLTSPQITWAAENPVYTGRFSNTAVGGYDTVSFFSGTPVEGSKEFTTTWKGADFRFANQANLDAFLANPGKYAPQYGGYCAWAVSQGYTAKGSPKHWDVVNGKLYLNYNRNIKDKWLQDKTGFISKADTNWPKVLD